MPHLGDELHHSGWNACSSCFGDPGKSRSRLILPALGSGRIYGAPLRLHLGHRKGVGIAALGAFTVTSFKLTTPLGAAIDVASEPREPRLAAEVSPEEIAATTGLAWPHTSHCLGDGHIMVSFMGEAATGEARGGFALFDQGMNFAGRWDKEASPFGYDFWYQPRLGVMISSGWGAPAAFTRGFDPADVERGRYADALYVWDWATHALKQTIPMGKDGAVPLETRFLHDPDAAVGFVGAALASNILRFHKAADAWAAEVAIRQEWTPVEGWALPEMPPLVSDIIVSLDDRWLYFSNWLRGDICQYDISDPAEPKLAGQIFLGGRRDRCLRQAGLLSARLTWLRRAASAKAAA